MGDTRRTVAVTRVRDGRRATDVDRAATEEPLEVRLHGRPFAVIMRTPGADRELAAGFLLAERVLAGPDDLGAIEHCTDAGVEYRGNVVNVTLANATTDAVERLLADRRQIMTSSSCGMCGRLTIESLHVDRAPIQSSFRMSAVALASLPDRLRSVQEVFDETGGLHAAGLFTRDGHLVDAAEDVGRHNAVDKVVGRMLMRDALPLADALLFVSGRTSFEIVQKAFLAGIPAVASVSAPSTLAVELAEASGITLAGFVRDGGFNIYTGASRVF